MEKGYDIEVGSDFKEWWRYNVIIMCGGFDGEQRKYVTSTEDAIAEIGTNIERAPDGYPKERITRLHTDDCVRIALYIYIIPHSLPQGRDIERSKPFEVTLHVAHNGEQPFTKTFSINQWSGASLELSIPTQSTPEQE